MLLKRAEDILRDYGIELYDLQVDVSNGNAVRFYNKHGFTLIRKLPNYYAIGNDAYLMVKELASRSAKRKRDSAQPQDAKRKRDSAQPQDAKRKRDSAQPQEYTAATVIHIGAAPHISFPRHPPRLSIPNDRHSSGHALPASQRSTCGYRRMESFAPEMPARQLRPPHSARREPSPPF